MQVILTRFFLNSTLVKVNVLLCCWTKWSVWLLEADGWRCIPSAEVMSVTQCLYFSFSPSFIIDLFIISSFNYFVMCQIMRLHFNYILTILSCMVIIKISPLLELNRPSHRVIKY